MCTALILICLGEALAGESANVGPASASAEALGAAPESGEPTLRPPELLSAPAVETPPEAPQGGLVELRLLIDERGEVEAARVLSGPPELGAAALRVAEGARFSPALEGADPVAVEVPWGVVFPPRLTPPPEPAPASPPEARAQPDEPDGLTSIFYRLSDAPTVRVIRPQDIIALPGTMGDPVRAVMLEPGVARTPLDSGWLLVRGGAPGDTGLYIDGVRVPLVYHLGGFTSAIHPSLVSQVEFVPSGFPVRYGDATAGVVNLRTRRVGETLRASGSVDTLASGLFVEAPIPAARHLGVSASIRRSYLDALLGLVPGVDVVEASVAPRFWDWSAALDSDPAGLLAFGYNDAIDVPAEEEGSTVTLRLGTARAHGRLDLLGGRLALTPFVAREWSTISADEIDDERAAKKAGLRAELVDGGRGPWGLSGGVEGQGGRWGMTVNSVDVSGDYGSVNPYASLRFGQERRLTLGARLETLFVEDQLPRLQPVGRLGATTPLTPHLDLVGDLGSYSGWPAFEWMFGLPAGAYLPLSRALGGGLGLRAHRGGLRYDVDAWGRAMSHIADIEEDGSLGQARGAAFGTEHLLSWAAGPWSARLLYTWSRSLRQPEPGLPWQAYLYDQPHSLNATAAWASGRGFTVAARFRLSSGYPRDPEVSEAYDILAGESRSLEQYTERLPPFHALDVKVSRPFSGQRWSMEGYLDLQNVYNRRVPEPAITGILYQSNMYTYGLPILPIFGVQGRFSKN